jgi:hypothetical protein
MMGAAVILLPVKHFLAGATAKLLHLGEMALA